MPPQVIQPCFWELRFPLTEKSFDLDNMYYLTQQTLFCLRNNFSQIHRIYTKKSVKPHRRNFCYGHCVTRFLCISDGQEWVYNETCPIFPLYIMSGRLHKLTRTYSRRHKAAVARDLRAAFHQSFWYSVTHQTVSCSIRSVNKLMLLNWLLNRTTGTICHSTQERAKLDGGAPHLRHSPLSFPVFLTSRLCVNQI